MAIYDQKGRCRCPYCGKFRKIEDFPDQAHHVEFGGKDIVGHLHIDPACKECLDQDLQEEPQCTH